MISKISPNAQLCDAPRSGVWACRIAGVVRCVAARLLAQINIYFTAQIAELRIVGKWSAKQRHFATTYRNI